LKPGSGAFFLRLSTGVRVTVETPNVQVVRVEKTCALKRKHIGDDQPMPFQED
jgi:hypothetical protein